MLREVPQSLVERIMENKRAACCFAGRERKRMTFGNRGKSAALEQVSTCLEEGVFLKLQD